MAETKGVLLNLPAETLDELDAACNASGAKRTEWIRDAIARKLAGNSLDSRASSIVSAFEHASERNREWLATAATIVMENELSKRQ